MRLRNAFLASVLLIADAGSALAGETVNYTYDALGRLTGVSHSGSVNNGVQASYVHDPADNRTNVTVIGASANSPPARVIVVPLNGFTVIPLGSG